MKSRLILGVAAGAAAFAAVAASAASLGGLSSSSLGADQVVVASCDSDGITVAYTTAYDAASSAYKVTSVNLSGVDAACDGKALQLTLASASASLADLSGVVTLTDGSQSVGVTGTVLAKDVTKTSLVIAG